MAAESISSPDERTVHSYVWSTELRVERSSGFLLGLFWTSDFSFPSVKWGWQPSSADLNVFCKNEVFCCSPLLSLRLINMAMDQENLLIVEGDPNFFWFWRKHNQPCTESDPSKYVIVETQCAEAYLLWNNFQDVYYLESSKNERIYREATFFSPPRQMDIWTNFCEQRDAGSAVKVLTIAVPSNYF